MPSFRSFHFGCRVNEAEKEALDRQMLAEKFSYQKDKPDVFIINTCAVTRKAEREARQMIYQTKRNSPKIKIVITGCAATYWQKNKLFQKLPIDLLVDNLNKEYLVKLIKKRFFSKASKAEQVAELEGSPGSAQILGLSIGKSSTDGGYSPAIDAGENSDRIWSKNYTSKFLNSGRLLIKVQDGCQRFCSFCIVPYLRGLPKSLTIRQIINQINNFSSTKSNKKSKDILFEQMTEGPSSEGVGLRKKYIELFSNNKISEVILTAINTEAFGYDTKEKFIDLIQAVIHKTKIPRISFGSIHPWSINNEFIDFYRQLNTDLSTSLRASNRLVKFLHIPLQSGSNTILRLMKRGYTSEEFMEKLKTIEKINPLTFISTDIIVGFLEETDKEFEETYKFLEESPISRFHIFRFSQRQNTAAYFLAKRLKEPTSAEKIKRAKALAELSKRKYLNFLQKNIGRTSTALILKKNPDNSYQGLLDNQLHVIINSNSHKLSPAEIVKVKVETSENQYLITKVDY